MIALNILYVISCIIGILFIGASFYLFAAAVGYWIGMFKLLKDKNNIMEKPYYIMPNNIGTHSFILTPFQHYTIQKSRGWAITLCCTITSPILLYGYYTLLSCTILAKCATITACLLLEWNKYIREEKVRTALGIRDSVSSLCRRFYFA